MEYIYKVGVVFVVFRIPPNWGPRGVWVESLRFANRKSSFSRWKLVFFQVGKMMLGTLQSNSEARRQPTIAWVLRWVWSWTVGQRRWTAGANGNF